MYKTVCIIVCVSLLQIMIPGRHECHGEQWKREYWGYLMTDKSTAKHAHDLICVDQAPETDAKGAANANHVHLYKVAGYQGALPCPPYTDQHALTCVVCSL